MQLSITIITATTIKPLPPGSTTATATTTTTTTILLPSMQWSHPLRSNAGYCRGRFVDMTVNAPAGASKSKIQPWQQNTFGLIITLATY